MKHLQALWGLLFLFTLATSAEAESKYIVHSSGYCLGISSDTHAVLVAPASASALRMSAQTDGSFLIALDGETETRYLSLGTSNGWTTYFVTDSTDTRAHYTIEQADGIYVKLKNAYTGKYLGTDSNDESAHTYSNKDGSDTKHLWILSDTPEVEIPVDTLSYPISLQARRQLIEGWGVSLCWWANMCGKWDDAKVDELVDWMVSPEGLNWNVFRYNIGGGDDPNWTNCSEHHMGNGKGLRAEMEGFQDERGGEFHWERDSAQRKIMLKIRERRPDAIFEAFSNSAPWWMTYSGCCAGNTNAGSDNLNTEYYTDFANYLVEVCKHYRDVYGIEFKTLEPFNEPNTSYWGANGGQEGCHFDPASQLAFLRVLAPVLKESGLNTVISASDETSISSSISTLNQYLSSDGIDLIGQWNTHTYSADNRARSQVGSLARAAGKTMWMSETGSGGSGISGNLNMAQRLIDDVRYIAPSSWVDWQYVEENNDQWCLVRGSFSAGTYARVKNYYVREQFTRFLRQGYTVLQSLNSQSLAALSPTEDTLVVALLNTDAECYHQISLPMTKIESNIQAWRTSESEDLSPVTDFQVLSDSILCVHTPAQSVTTLQIPVSKIEPQGETEDIAYLIVPQSSVSVAAASVDGYLKLANANAADPAQRWHLIPVSDGVVQLQNEQGETVNYPGSYNIRTTTGEVTNGNLSIEDVDGIHQRIMMAGDSQGRGWDLQSNALTAGTTIGMYAYGTSAAADTRQWFLMPVGQKQMHTEPDLVVSPNTEYQNPNTPYYTLSGIRVEKPTIRGLYLHNGKKVLR